MVKKIILMFLSLLTVTVIGIGAYGLTILNQTTGTLSKTYKGFGNETNVIAENKPMTILLMGVDTGSGSREDPWAGNSDTMILVTVNPQTKETTILPISIDLLLAASLEIVTANGAPSSLPERVHPIQFGSSK